MFLVFIPMFIGFIVNDQTAITTGLIMSGVCFVAYLPFLLVLVGILRSYIITSWTLSYLSWASPALKKAVVVTPSEPVAVPPAEPLPDPLTGS
jgi:hypothetical protein